MYTFGCKINLQIRGGTSFKKGIDAENIASQYLMSLGYVVIGSRIKTKYGEIDILCSIHDTLIAVEVKYRARENNLHECISWRQRTRITNAFLSIIDYYTYKNYRIDVIYLSGVNGGSINHVENAFYIEDYTSY